MTTPTVGPAPKPAAMPRFVTLVTARDPEGSLMFELMFVYKIGSREPVKLFRWTSATMMWAQAAPHQYGQTVLNKAVEIVDEYARADVWVSDTAPPVVERARLKHALDVLVRRGYTFEWRKKQVQAGPLSPRQVAQLVMIDDDSADDDG